MDKKQRIEKADWNCAQMNVYQQMVQLANEKAYEYAERKLIEIFENLNTDTLKPISQPMVKNEEGDLCWVEEIIYNKNGNYLTLQTQSDYDGSKWQIALTECTTQEVIDIFYQLNRVFRES